MDGWMDAEMDGWKWMIGYPHLTTRKLNMACLTVVRIMADIFKQYRVHVVMKYICSCQKVGIKIQRVKSLPVAYIK